MLRYSDDKKGIVKLAREKGMTDGQILSAACANETATRRREIVKQWAESLGLTEEEAIDVAKREAILK